MSGVRRSGRARGRRRPVVHGHMLLDPPTEVNYKKDATVMRIDAPSVAPRPPDCPPFTSNSWTASILESPMVPRGSYLDDVSLPPYSAHPLDHHYRNTAGDQTSIIRKWWLGRPPPAAASCQSAIVHAVRLLTTTHSTQRRGEALPPPSSRLVVYCAPTNFVISEPLAVVLACVSRSIARSKWATWLPQGLPRLRRAVARDAIPGSANVWHIVNDAALLEQYLMSLTISSIASLNETHQSTSYHARNRGPASFFPS